MVVTSLTRNQVVHPGTWVRIPPSPLKPLKIKGFFICNMEKPSLIGIHTGCCVQLHAVSNEDCGSCLPAPGDGLRGRPAARDESSFCIYLYGVQMEFLGIKQCFFIQYPKNREILGIEGKVYALLSKNLDL